MINKSEAQAIAAGRHRDPFSILGLHSSGGSPTIRAFRPDAESIEVVGIGSGMKIASLEPVAGAMGLFEGKIDPQNASAQYVLRYQKGEHIWEARDPYQFGPVMGELDEHLIGEGEHRRLWEVLGAHVMEHEGAQGVHFALWAPNALRVSLIGNFNDWDGRTNAMRRRGVTGVWEIFMPEFGEGETYKFEILDQNGNLLPLKADPVGFGSEHPPKTASVVRELSGYQWNDQAWMSKRALLNSIDKPISIYEAHLGSWRRVPEEGNRPLSYREHAKALVSYVKDLGFTHIELMPISEFPFEGSWGYQPIGLFSPTIRHGSLNEFRDFVEACHEADIGLILDWVPGHFPEDLHGLGNFDGTPLYEHADRREGFHPDWNTLIYNYGRKEVENYLIANALYWLREHHVDSLRVDAVASMLYRDYSREDGQWIPNKHGGRENLEAIAFLRRMNEAAYGDMPGIMTIAEESTAFPGVSTPTDHGGLGFGFKWNMGWMNDTLQYISEDSVHRKHHHSKMTFGLQYAFTENFILPISHDEVVHGKGSLLDKMPGDGFEKFANLRAYFGFMWGHPGKKLLFMGCEFAQGIEWDHDSSLQWHLLDHPSHRGMQRLIKDLNALYVSTPALHEFDCKPEGFEWIQEHAADESVYAWVRKGDSNATPVLVVSNFTPVERSGWRLGVPESGRWIEALNTDAEVYGGAGIGNLGLAVSENIAASGRAHSISITLPPLSTLFFVLDRPGMKAKDGEVLAAENIVISTQTTGGRSNG